VTASPVGQLNGYMPIGLKPKHVMGGVEVIEKGTDKEPVFYAEVCMGIDGRARLGREGDGDEDVSMSGAGQQEEEEEEETELPSETDRRLNVIFEGEAISCMFAFPYATASMMGVGSVVYGCLREWDGLINLLAIRMNDAPWLYRGYLTSNGNWIGRSRDTWTVHLDQEGYEGVFVMTKR